MPQKSFLIDGIGNVVVQKRRNNKSLRLSITNDGNVRVTQPYWLPYPAGINFAKSKQAWISSNLPTKRPPLISGQKIGKFHTLVFERKPSIAAVTYSVSRIEVRVTLPDHLNVSEPSVQKKANLASVEALKQESKELLTKRVAELAAANGYHYKQLRYKALKSRWGSCSRSGIINLNLYLIQLPWELIDYVILHELVHTVVMSHDQKFWVELSKHVSDPKTMRRQLKPYRPVLNPIAPTKKLVA